MEERTRKDKEFWLIDITSLKSMEYAKTMLNNLPLDIDDDIFPFMFVNDTFVDIWEIYKLESENDPIVRKFGLWKTNMGIFSTAPSKWQRRKDLTVSFAKIIISHVFLFL